MNDYELFRGRCRVRVPFRSIVSYQFKGKEVSICIERNQFNMRYRKKARPRKDLLILFGTDKSIPQLKGIFKIKRVIRGETNSVIVAKRKDLD